MPTAASSSDSGPAPRPGRMLVVTAAWGACFVAIRYGLGHAPTLWLASWRALLAGAMLLLAAGLTHRPLPRRSDWPILIWLGLINVGLAFAAMFTASTGVSSGVASVLANAAPLLIVLPAWALYHERPRTTVLVGLAVGYVGLVVTALPAGGGRGAVLSLGAAAAITVGTLLSRRLTGVDVIQLSAWQFLIGGAMLTGWAAATEGPPQVSWSPQFVLALAFLALVGSAASYLLWFAELQRSALVSVSAWTMLTPIFGVTFGWLFLRDPLSGEQGIGSVLVLAALAVILAPSPHRRRPEPSRSAETSAPSNIPPDHRAQGRNTHHPLPGVVLGHQDHTREEQP